MMRAKVRAENSVYDSSMLVWLNESGCDRRNAIQKYRYSVRAMRQYYTAPTKCAFPLT